MTTIIDGGHGVALHLEEGATARKCGDCQLCCKLLPVRAVGKEAGHRCRHQRHHKGCAVYAKLNRVSPECRLWNCRWLVNDDADDLKRPDRSHYVLDIMPEYVTHVDGEGLKTVLPVVQIWVDPGFPDAHHDPALRAWLLRHSLAENGVAGLVRYSDEAGFVIFPPNISGDGEWHEMHSNLARETHSVEDIVRALGGAAK
jgi:hypothetical protein